MKNYTEKEKQIIAKHPQFAGIKFSPVVEFETESPDDDVNPLLDIIYSLDDVTKLPKGDISVFLSKNTSPEVRQFITDNLHAELGDTPSLPADFDGDISNLMREKGESRADYAARITKLMREENEKVLLSKKFESEK